MTYLYVIAYILIFSYVFVFIVCFFVLLHRYKRAKDYNRFVDELYTQNNKDTPVIIGRIQYDYISSYNNYRNQQFVLKAFFNPLSEQGVNPQN